MFEAYLRRYPNGTFAEIAKINLQDVKQAAAQPIAPDEKTPLSDAGLLREINVQDASMSKLTKSFSEANKKKLLSHEFDRNELARARLPYEQLDQLTMEIIMGVR